jgi:hypothetical protein
MRIEGDEEIDGAVAAILVIATRLRTISFSSAIVAAILGVAGSSFGQEWFASWIGVMTTITVAVMAYGLLDRRQYLAATYSVMATRLSRIKEKFSEATDDLASLVTATEDLNFLADVMSFTPSRLGVT